MADAAGARAMMEPPIKEITRRIVDAWHPRRVVMFGSRARGNPRPDSDVDLLIEAETDLPPYERMRSVLELFGLRRWALDVVVLTPSEVVEHRLYRNSLLNAIEAEGRVLYEQP